MENMTKGQIWRNKRTNQLERINYVAYTEPFAKTEHYLRSQVSDALPKTDLEKVSHGEALAYVEQQREFESLRLPPLPLKAGI